MNYLEITRPLRADQQTHYNCCQSVLVTFAPEMGLSRDQAYALGTYFNGGMRHGSVCGALAGAMMVLGMAGCAEQGAAEVLEQFREKHGVTDCASLLKGAQERGEERKAHCDSLVYELVEAVARILERTK